MPRHGTNFPGLDPNAISIRCHVCFKKPKLDVPLAPIPPTRGFSWYFNHPCDSKDIPDLLCNPNRDTNLDPQLVEIIQVSKDRFLENTTRKVRPNNWETAFWIQVHLSDADGKLVVVSMNFFCFIMNPKWKRDPIVKFLEDWICPATIEFLGIVRRNDVTYNPRPPASEQPAPASPYGCTKQPDSEPESDEEPQTKAVKDKREKREEQEMVERFEKFVLTPGPKFEEVFSNTASPSTGLAAIADLDAGSGVNRKRRRMEH